MPPLVPAPAAPWPGRPGMPALVGGRTAPGTPPDVADPGGGTTGLICRLPWPGRPGMPGADRCRFWPGSDGTGGGSTRAGCGIDDAGGGGDGAGEPEPG